MSETIQIQLPDGSVKAVPKGTTALDIARSIGPRLAEAALVAKTNGDLIDLTRPLEKDTTLRILTEKDPEALEVFRHSSAHLLAAAVLELFPETKLGHGPPTESGFFYDFYREKPFTQLARRPGAEWRPRREKRTAPARTEPPSPPRRSRCARPLRRPSPIRCTHPPWSCPRRRRR